MDFNPEQMQRNQAAAQQQQQQMEQQEAARKTMLGHVLSQEANARLSTIRLTKPEKAQQLEAYILQSAQMGRLSGKLSEQELVSMVTQLNTQQAAASKVKFDRRRCMLDSDSD